MEDVIQLEKIYKSWQLSRLYCTYLNRKSIPFQLIAPNQREENNKILEIIILAIKEKPLEERLKFYQERVEDAQIKANNEFFEEAISLRERADEFKAFFLD